MMKSRIPLMAANWKMNLKVDESGRLSLDDMTSTGPATAP